LRGTNAGRKSRSSGRIKAGGANGRKGFNIGCPGGPFSNLRDESLTIWGGGEKNKCLHERTAGRPKRTNNPHKNRTSGQKKMYHGEGRKIRAPCVKGRGGPTRETGFYVLKLGDGRKTHHQGSKSSEGDRKGPKRNKIQKIAQKGKRELENRKAESVGKLDAGETGTAGATHT